MSTRGSFIIRRDGKEKALYIASDAYPSYTAPNVIKLIRKLDLELLFEKMEKSEDSEEPDCYCFNAQYLMEWYEEDDGFSYKDDSGFILDSLMCEYAYVLNLDSEELEFYVGFQHEPQVGNRYGEDISYTSTRGENYYPCRLVSRYSFGYLKLADSELVVENMEKDAESNEVSVYKLESDIGMEKERTNRYSKALAQDIPIFSENMGMKKMKRLKHNAKYHELNNCLMDLYRRTRQTKEKVSLYSVMQNVTDNKTDWNDAAYSELLKRCSKLRVGWNIRLHSEDNYWIQLVIGDDSWFHSISKIKVYVTSKGSNIKELVIGAMERLMTGAKEGFEVMISKVERDGTACFFVGKHDFFILESYFDEHKEFLRIGNNFIAHRGMLGISRDLMDIDSHNGQQAKLISDYFDLIVSPDEIDVEEMYQMFVLGWNGQLVDENPFSRDFRNCTAQMFVIMLDTLDNLLGDAEINDDSLLLNDDVKIWDALARARCWGDLRW